MTLKPSIPQLAFFSTILVVGVIFIATILVFDIIGVIAVSIADVLTLSKKSMLYLAYPIWIVNAVFASLFYTSFSYSKIKKSNASKNKYWIIFLIAVVLSGLSLYIFKFYGQMNNDKFDYYVPGNAGLTYIFFITVSLLTIFFINLELYKKNKT